MATKSARSRLILITGLAGLALAATGCEVSASTNPPSPQDTGDSGDSGDSG